MSSYPTPAGMEITGTFSPEYANILSTDAVSFLARLSRAFEPRRQALLAARQARAQRLDAGEKPDFLSETQNIRQGQWAIHPLPGALMRRRVEITGPVERKMLINALNSGADSYMADFEDANTPSWAHQLDGQINVRDAVRGTIECKIQGKIYQLNPSPATLLVRPRGWHLDEKHVLIDGKAISGGLFDFALCLFHNGKEQIARGIGPYFYLPKLESHLEARLWNDIFIMAQELLGLPRGAIKATVLIETILAAFEMEEILYELREHSAGLNAGRWDYIFSCIKKFKADKDFCLADRATLTMTTPFLRAYALLLLKTCHKRGAPAIGGMSALIPIKQDAEKNSIALAGVRADKIRDATDGYDGGWVAHPGLVPVAMQAFKEILGDAPHQIEKQRPDVQVSAADLLHFAPEKPITEKGLRNNIRVGIYYIGAWMAGQGCVPIDNLMEDAATAEISRAQVWQWIHSPKGRLDDGREITADLVSALISEELARIKEDIAESGASPSTYDKAAVLFERLSTAAEFTEFLTLPLYQQL